jgi:hypothetical protein
VIVLEYERDRGFVVLDCQTHADEHRLRLWLRRSAAFATLPRLAARLLDDLDDFDAEHAA